jgi:AcrR family transcriptional regulator
MPASPRGSLPYFRSKQGLFFSVCDDYIATIERIGKQAIERSSTTAAAQIQQGIHNLLAMSTQIADQIRRGQQEGEFDRSGRFTGRLQV